MVVSMKSDIANKLSALQKEFHQQLPGKIAEIESQWEELSKGYPCDITLEDLHRMVHGLAGSGGTFGAENISKAAKDLERMLMALLTRPAQTPPFSNSIQQEAHEFIMKIRQAMDDWKPSDMPYI